MGRKGFERYRTIFIGIVLVLAGIAAAGCFLAAAGRGSAVGAVILSVAAAVLLLGGLGLLAAGSRARGGMLWAAPTASERRHYSDVYRSAH
jgi:hypothetical protein